MCRSVIRAALTAAMLVAAGATIAGAQQGATVRFELPQVEVVVHELPFLSDEELETLRLVGQNEEALALFLSGGVQFGAMAVAPADGFIRGGMPADSATAVSDLPDLGAARSSALAQCNATRSGGPACQIALEIIPR
ncbi:MAG: hypothetical protein JJT99_12460 [Rhodobacteraceae bacterium]|nr:hypothetical protein [Paracoccaceae bacterium]